jgi:glycosyltransferase involved in cell wall biosynthesis
MKQGLFITDVSVTDSLIKTNGIVKKIVNQVSALNIEGQLSFKIFNLPRLKGNPIIMFISYLLCDIYSNISFDFFSYDYIYVRRIIPLNYSFIKLLKTIRKKNNVCKIVYEIPTYPYDKEHKKLKGKMCLFIEKIFRTKLKKYIDKIITLSNDDIIFGIPTIKIVNGINCTDIKIRKPTISFDIINLIAVAQFARWHGYDRLIEGLDKYYEKKESCRNLYIHFVGDGPEVNNLRNLVQQLNLDKYIIFHGALFGEELSNIFDKADIAVSSLGCHRIGIFLGSFLKSREYLARGIPMISSTKVDILPSGFEYCLYVPEDESPIDMQSILNFYQKLTAKHSVSEITKNIRKFAEDNCDMSKTMLPVIEYLNK